MHPLDAARFKVVRAKEHIDVLRRELLAYGERDYYRVVPEIDEENRQYLLRAEVQEMPNPYWGTIIGDILHNLRSSLNYVACELVRLNNGRITVRTQFPVFDKKARFDEKAPGMLAGVSPDAFAFIEGLQPYHRREPSGHPLAILGRMSNADKHRILQTAIFAIESIDQDVRAVTGRGSIRILEFNPGPIEDGAVVARFEVAQAPDAPTFEVKVDAEVRSHILIDNRWRPRHFEVVHDFVQAQVVQRAERFFPS